MIKTCLRFLFFFFFLFSVAHAQDCSIVFVHIGKQLPEYLETSVTQARKFNPDSDIYVIGNRRAFRKKKEFFQKYAIKTVACEALKMSSEHEKFLKKSKIDSSFREGFWKYAIERFFYLDELMHQDQLTHVFHLETDVMIYSDLKTLMPTFQKYYPGIAATFDNDERCIAGLIYFSGPKSIKRLSKYMAKTASKNYNDMDVLSSYRKGAKTSHIDHLPIIMNDYKEPLVSATGLKVRDEALFSNHFEEFFSLFDAAALGQYLGGEDPRNGSKGPGFVNESCVFNPSKLQFHWKKDERGRKVPYVMYKGKECRINNLHIHSKNLTEFRSWD